jgi:hypothetical protein
MSSFLQTRLRTVALLCAATVLFIATLAQAHASAEASAVVSSSGNRYVLTEGLAAQDHLTWRVTRTVVGFKGTRVTSWSLPAPIQEDGATRFVVVPRDEVFVVGRAAPSTFEYREAALLDERGLVVAAPKAWTDERLGPMPVTTRVVRRHNGQAAVSIRGTLPALCPAHSKRCIQRVVLKGDQEGADGDAVERELDALEMSVEGDRPALWNYLEREGLDFNLGFNEDVLASAPVGQVKRLSVEMTSAVVSVARSRVGQARLGRRSVTVGGYDGAELAEFYVGKTAAGLRLVDYAPVVVNASVKLPADAPELHGQASSYFLTQDFWAWHGSCRLAHCPGAVGLWGPLSIRDLSLTADGTLAVSWTESRLPAGFTYMATRRKVELWRVGPAGQKELLKAFAFMLDRPVPDPSVSGVTASRHVASVPSVNP